MNAMEPTRAKVSENGQLVLPAQVQDALGLRSGTEVEIVLHDRYIELRQERPRLSKAELTESLKAMQAMFAGGPSLEDELYKMRREEDEHQKRKFGC